MKKYIIEGYLGIIPLDLTNVEPKYHKTMINQHKKDIEEYKLEQEKLPPKLRYENCIGRVHKQLEHEKYLHDLRIEKHVKEQDKKYELLLKLYSK